NRSFAGGLQPLVMPAAARASMSPENTESASSENRSGPGGSPRARARKAAISPRVTGSSGQKRSLRGGLHPRVMSAARIASMSSSWTEPSSSTNVPPEGAGRPRAALSRRGALRRPEVSWFPSCPDDASDVPAAVGFGGSALEGAHDERGHLPSGHGIVGAEGGGRAASGDPRRRQRVDRLPVDVAGGVVETGGRCRRQVEGPHQEARHLAAGHGGVGAEPPGPAPGRDAV